MPASHRRRYRAGGVTLGVPHLEMSLARGEVPDQSTRHRHLALGVLRQRHAHRIAYAVGQQRAYSHCALYATLDAVARLRHTQMQRVCHALALHSLDQKPVRMHHDAGVARLHRDHHAVEVQLAALPEKLHCRFDHALGRIAVAVDHAPRERAVVDAYAQRRAAAPAYLHQTLQLSRVVAEITRVDTHLVDRLGRYHRHVGREVYVGHYGRRIAVGAHRRGYVCQRPPSRARPEP